MKDSIFKRMFDLIFFFQAQITSKSVDDVCSVPQIHANIFYHTIDASPFLYLTLHSPYFYLNFTSYIWNFTMQLNI